MSAPLHISRTIGNEFTLIAAHETPTIANKFLAQEIKVELTPKQQKVEKEIKKAIIPLAGKANRMFPASIVVKKAFLPIIDKDGIMWLDTNLGKDTYDIKEMLKIKNRLSEWKEVKKILSSAIKNIINAINTNNILLFTYLARIVTIL